MTHAISVEIYQFTAAVRFEIRGVVSVIFIFVLLQKTLFFIVGIQFFYNIRIYLSRIFNNTILDARLRW